MAARKQKQTTQSKAFENQTRKSLLDSDYAAEARAMLSQQSAILNDKIDELTKKLAHAERLQTRVDYIAEISGFNPSTNAIRILKILNTTYTPRGTVVMVELAE